MSKDDSSAEDIKFLKNPLSVLKDDYIAIAAELLGTILFVFLGVAGTCSVLSIPTMSTASKMIGVGLSFGFGLGTVIFAVANISGGHLNPAVTLGLACIGQVELFKAIFYMIAQFLGGICGAALAWGVLPNNVAEAVDMAANKVFPGVTIGEALGMEIMFTFVLQFTVCATAKLGGDLKHMGRFAPLIIGLSVFLGNLTLGPFTGASMNPARSFGPAVVSSHWHDHWIFWVGPGIGSVLASLIYFLLFIFKNGEDD